MSPRDFIYPNSPYIDSEFEDFIKLLKGRGDYEEKELRFKYSLLNKNYTNHIQRTTTQNVVLKIITKGSTNSHLNTLLNYVSRNLESQKDEEKPSMFDQNNEEITKDDFSDLIKDWSDKFDQFDIKKTDKEIIDKIDVIKNDLNDKYFDEGLNQKEAEFLKSIKLFEKAEFRENKRYEGALYENKTTKELGFILRSEHPENASFYCIDHYPYISKTTVPLNNLKSMDRDIQKISRTKPNNFSHIILSAGGDNPDPKAILEGTKDFLELNFKSQGYDYAYTLHTDTKHPHVHVVLNNHSKQHDYKFIPDKYDLQELRMDYTRHLDGYGVNRTAVLKYDQKKSLDIAIKEIKNNENYNIDWYRHKLNDKQDKNFDLLKFKKKSLSALNRMSKTLEFSDQHELAKKVKEQKQSFIDAEKEHIPKIIENTMKILEKDDQKWREHCEKPFKKSLGAPKNYYKSKEVQEEMLEKYEKHLETVKEDLENLPYYGVSEEIIIRQEKAVEYIDKKLAQLDKKLDREPRDQGRCLEMER